MTATSPGAQTERRGGAGPVRGLLGGKDFTGRISRSYANINSLEITFLNRLLVVDRVPWTRTVPPRL